MPNMGTVRVWNADEGWGVIDAAEVPGGCWAHFSAIVAGGYRELAEGQRVAFTAEPGPQDGYDFRAVQVWPEGTSPGSAPPGSAYSSTLTLSFDDE